MEANHEDHFKNQKQILGEFIRSQRQLARLSLRELAEKTNISNPYLSQIERGLHEPSVRILKAIAQALNVSASSLLSQLGASETIASQNTTDENNDIETAIFSDKHLSQYQKEVLVATYRTFMRSNFDSIQSDGEIVSGSKANKRGKQHQEKNSKNN